MSVGSDKLRLLRRIPSVRFDEEMRGYSKSQVDRVLQTLAPLADEIEALQHQLDEANARADEAVQQAQTAVVDTDPVVAAEPAAAAPDGDFDETLRNTLLLAQRTADQTIRDAEANAEKVRSESTARADSIMADARTEAKELKGEAHAQREQMLADAESERARLLADALEHAETRKQAIEEELLNEQGIRRNDLLAEISQLERGRDELNADVVRFEEFLEGRRQSVREALEELEAVLDDPSKLAEPDVPEPADVGLLDPEELTGLGVDSHSIGTLATEVEAARQQAADFAFSEPEDDDEPAADVADETLEFDSPIDTGADDTTPFETFEDAVDTDRPDADIEVDIADVESPSIDATAEFDPPVDAVPMDEFAAPDVDDSFAAPVEAEASFEPTPPEVPAAEQLDHFSAEGAAVDHPFQADPPAPEAPVEVSWEQPQPEAGDPFATGGYTEVDPNGIPASVTPDSVFSSVPETSDPSAYTNLEVTDPGSSDPTGLGIDVESPFANEPAADAQPGLGGLAEQARSRLASRVSRLRDTAVPEDEDQAAPVAEEVAAPPVANQAPTIEYVPEEQPPPPAPTFIEQPAPSFPPPPEVADFVSESTPAFASDPVDGAEWSAPDPSRPLHPDARIEDLPPDDPFLDELRQMTGGEQPEGDDETLNRFLADDGEKDGGSGWFGRKNR